MTEHCQATLQCRQRQRTLKFPKSVESIWFALSKFRAVGDDSGSVTVKRGNTGLAPASHRSKKFPESLRIDRPSPPGSGRRRRHTRKRPAPRPSPPRVRKAEVHSRRSSRTGQGLTKLRSLAGRTTTRHSKQDATVPLLRPSLPRSGGSRFRTNRGNRCFRTRQPGRRTWSTSRTAPACLTRGQVSLMQSAMSN